MTFALSDLVRGLVVLSVHPRQAEVAPGAAKAFGFSIPAGVLSIVDEVIESMTDVRFWGTSVAQCPLSAKRKTFARVEFFRF